MTPTAPTSERGRTDRGLYPLVFACLGGAVACLSLQSTLLPLALAFLALGVLAVQDLRVVMVLSYPIYALFGALTSVAVIEHGAYVTEQFRYGSANGATAALAVYAISFVTAGHLAISSLSGRGGHGAAVTAMRLRRLMIGICLGSAVFYGIAITMVGTGFAYVDLRFGWARALPGPLAVVHNMLVGFLIPAAFAMAGICATIRRRIDRGLAVLLLPVLSMILIGTKFSAFNIQVTMAVTGVGVGWLLTDRKPALRVRHFGYAVLFAAIMFASILIGYRAAGSDDPMRSFEQRIALQGHVWWGVYDRYDGEPAVQLSRLVAPNTLDRPAGLDLLSYLVSPPEYVYQHISQGIHFTTGGAAGVLAVFGLLPGLVVYGLLGALYGPVIRYLRHTLEDARPAFTVAGLVMLTIWSYATQTGDWSISYQYLSLICYVAVGTYLLTHRRRSHLSARLAGEEPLRRAREGVRPRAATS